MNTKKIEKIFEGNIIKKIRGKHPEWEVIQADSTNNAFTEYRIYIPYSFKTTNAAKNRFVVLQDNQTLEFIIYLNNKYNVVSTLDELIDLIEDQI